MAVRSRPVTWHVGPLGALGICVALSLVVFATGGGTSPLQALWLAYVVLVAWQCSRKLAILAITLAIAANLAPFVYEHGALSGTGAGWALTITVTLVVVGLASTVAVGRLRDTIRLDAERLETIVGLHREVEGAEFDVEGVVLDVLERARTLLGATAATAGVIEGEKIVYKYRTGPGRNSDPIVTPRDGSLSGICARSGEVVYCEDSEQDSRVDKAACESRACVRW